MSEQPPPTGSGRAKFAAACAVFLAAVFLLAWRTNGMATDFDRWFGGRGGASRDVWAFLFQFGSFFLVAFAWPFGLLREGRPAARFGLAKPQGPRALLWTAVAIPLVVVPVAWFASRMPDVRAAYPMLRSLPAHPQWIVPYEAAYVLLYYVAWEAFFRGWLLWTVEAGFGAVAAVLVQTAASSLAHVGPPFAAAEPWGAVPFGLLTGWIAWKTRSIWPTFALHAALGVSTDLFVLWT